MRLPKGVQRVTKHLNDGQARVYHYYRATRARIEGEPGSPEFAASLSAAKIARRRQTSHDYDLERQRRRLGDYAARAASIALYRAKYRGLMCTITVEHVRAVMAAQGWRCAVTGLEFNLVSERKTRRPHPFQPSLDRIDSSQGYVPGNVRVVCYAVNIALSDWGEAVFLKIVAATVAHRLMAAEKSLQGDAKTEAQPIEVKGQCGSPP